MSKNIDELRTEGNKVKVKVVSSEPVRTEKDGIVYFKQPQKYGYFDFASKYPECDALILPASRVTESGVIYVVAYAKAPKYNDKISELRCENDNYGIFVNARHREEIF